MGRRLRCFLPLVALLLSFASSSVLALGQAHHPSTPTTSAYIYVGWYLGQWPNLTDYISGYAVGTDGSLQPLSGYPVNGPSFGLISIGNFVFGDDGRYIATYARGSDGSLRQTSIVDDYQYATQPNGMSIYALNPDRSGQTLTTVLSCGSCNSYILPWAIGADGQLSFLGGPLPPGGAAKWDGVFFFSPDNNFAYTEFWQSGASEFRRNPNGTLTYVQQTGSAPPPPVPNPDPNGDVCLPGDMAGSVSTGYMAIAWWSGIYCSDGPAYDFATYRVAADGSLQLVPGTTFIPQVVELSMAFDPTGQYLAIGGCTGQYYCTGRAALQIYKLQSDGRLTPVGGQQNVTATAGFISVQWDNANHIYAFGYDECCNHNLSISPLYIYNFDGQNLTPAPGSPHPFVNAAGLAIAPQP